MSSRPSSPSNRGSPRSAASGASPRSAASGSSPRSHLFEGAERSAPATTSPRIITIPLQTEPVATSCINSVTITGENKIDAPLAFFLPDGTGFVVTCMVSRNDGKDTHVFLWGSVFSDYVPGRMDLPVSISKINSDNPSITGPYGRFDSTSGSTNQEIVLARQAVLYPVTYVYPDEVGGYKKDMKHGVTRYEKSEIRAMGVVEGMKRLLANAGSRSKTIETSRLMCPMLSFLDGSMFSEYKKAIKGRNEKFVYDPATYFTTSNCSGGFFPVLLRVSKLMKIVISQALSRDQELGNTIFSTFMQIMRMIENELEMTPDTKIRSLIRKCINEIRDDETDNTTFAAIIEELGVSNDSSFIFNFLRDPENRDDIPYHFMSQLIIANRKRFNKKGEARGLSKELEEVLTGEEEKQEEAAEEESEEEERQSSSGRSRNWLNDLSNELRDAIREKYWKKGTRTNTVVSQFAYLFRKKETSEYEDIVKGDKSAGFIGKWVQKDDEQSQARVKAVVDILKKYKTKLKERKKP